MSEAEASVERLFNEPFEPLWLIRQREAEEDARRELVLRRKAEKNKWRQTLIDRANELWRLEAEESHRRIMANCRGVWHIS